MSYHIYDEVIKSTSHFVKAILRTVRSDLAQHMDVTKPFNIASYSLLTLMIARVTGLAPGEFVHTLGDAHLYLNHLEQADLQLKREPLPLPQMKINPEVNNIFDFHYEDFELVGYQSHPSIAAPTAV